MNTALLVLGGALGGASGGALAVIAARKRREVRVEGRLVQWVEGRRHANRIALSPLIEFTTREGQTVQVTGPSNDRLESWRRDAVGTSMPVDYDPACPERAFAGPPIQRYYAVVMLAGAAVASIIVGLTSG